MDLPLATQNRFFQSNPRWITCVHQELIQSMYNNAGFLASSDQRLRDDYWQLPVQLKSFHFWASQLAEAIKCYKLQPGAPIQSKSVHLTWKQQQTLSSKWLLVALSMRMMNNFCRNQASSAPAIISSRGAVDVELLETKLVQERSNSLPEPWILVSNLLSILGSIGSRRQWAPDFGVRSGQGHIEGIWRLKQTFQNTNPFNHHVWLGVLWGMSHIISIKRHSSSFVCCPVHHSNTSSHGTFESCPPSTQLWCRLFTLPVPENTSCSSCGTSTDVWHHQVY